MELSNSYSSAFRACLQSQSFCIAQLHHLGKSMNIDTSGCYKIIYVQSGNKNFCIGSHTYVCNAGDVFLATPKDWHYFSDYNVEESHERIIFFIHPQYLGDLSSPQTDLLHCFQQASATGSFRLALSSNSQLRFQHLVSKLLHPDAYGFDLLSKCYFTELCVLLNREFLENSATQTGQEQPPTEHFAVIDQIIAYINQHICENLTSENLAEHFFLSQSYLCRIFKRSTGTTPHKYIIAQRITLAKDLLSAGSTVSEACYACGFNDYSHFIKIFTNSVGVSPKKYAKLC